MSCDAPDYQHALNEATRFAEITKEIQWLIDHTYGTLNYGTYPPVDVETARKYLDIAWRLTQFLEFSNLFVMDVDRVPVISEETNDNLEILTHLIEKTIRDLKLPFVMLDTLKLVREVIDQAFKFDKALQVDVRRWEKEVW